MALLGMTFVHSLLLFFHFVKGYKNYVHMYLSLVIEIKIIYIFLNVCSVETDLMKVNNFSVVILT